MRKIAVIYAMKINPVNSNQNIEFEGNKAISQKTGSIFDEQNQ